MIYEQVLVEHNRLTKQITSIQEQLKQFPEGHLLCTRNGTRCKWYQRISSEQIYIPKSNRALAQTLARKKYLYAQLDDLTQEKTALEYYLQHHNPTSRVSKLLNNPPYLELLQNAFIPSSQTFTDWMHESFEANPRFSEQLIHKTLSGHYVRSKSEVLIDMVLYTHQIPFRYESPLQLGDITLYPDFTIRHPQNGEFFYWEHFGLMDDTNYSKNAISKLQFYNSFGIIPSIQLITTFETSKHPLNIHTLEKIVEQYFL